MNCECGCGAITSIADRTDPSTNRVKGRPMRFISGHNGRRTPDAFRPEDRGYETQCWTWLRNKSRGGYGLMQDGPKTRGAHRVYYERWVGPIPEGMDLDHLCRNRDCVRPDHLEPVTGAENCRRGKNAKITAEIAADIRLAKAEGGRFWGRNEIAARLGLNPIHVQHIADGKVWA